MPSFLYRLRQCSYERADANEQPPPSTLDGLPPVFLAPPSHRPLSGPPSPCLPLRAAVSPSQCGRALQRCYLDVSYRSWLLLAAALSALLLLLLLSALCVDEFVIIHSRAADRPPEAVMGAFHYCALSPASSCHRIDQHCAAGGAELTTLLGYSSESGTCSRFDAFRAFFLLAFMLAIFAPFALLALSRQPGSWRLPFLVTSLHVAVALCSLLSMAFFLPMLPSSSSSSAPAWSRLSHSFWLLLCAFLLALALCSALCIRGKHARWWTRPRHDGGEESDSTEEERAIVPRHTAISPPAASEAQVVEEDGRCEEPSSSPPLSQFTLGIDLDADADVDERLHSVEDDEREELRRRALLLLLLRAEQPGLRTPIAGARSESDNAPYSGQRVSVDGASILELSTVAFDAECGSAANGQEPRSSRQLP